MPEVLFVALGETRQFRAIKKPEEAPWPAGKPVWTGASGSGTTALKTFDTVSASAEDFKLVKAECGNTVEGKVVVFSVDILSLDATDPSSTKLMCQVEPSGLTLDSVDFKITESRGGELHLDSKMSVSGDFDFTFNQKVLERSSWIWDEDGYTDEIGPNTLKIIGHKDSALYQSSCYGRLDTHWTAHAREIVQAYFLVEGVGLRLYGHEIAESYDKFSYTVPFTGKDLWVGSSHIILDVNHPEDYINISWGESHKYNNAGGEFGAQMLGAARGEESEHQFYNGHSYSGWPDLTNLKGIGRVDSLFWGTFAAIQYSNREVDRTIP